MTTKIPDECYVKVLVPNKDIECSGFVVKWDVPLGSPQLHTEGTMMSNMSHNS